METLAPPIMQQTDEDELYACPQTRRPLRRDGDVLLGAERSYPLRNGIPQFLRFTNRQESDDARKLARLNDLARDNGWLAALKEIYGEGSEMYRYVTSPRRAKFLDLLPLAKESVVLEIGPGLGQFSPLIASRVKWLYATEIDPAQAEFTLMRCGQQNAGNVSVACGGDDCRLPYRDDSFDAIVANLVFEWCGSHNREDSPQQSQRRFLQECRRVLKPGGALWLATKNRYAIRSLFGKPDEHVYGMRFGNALPRAIMNLLLKLRGKDQAEGILYSHNRLAKLLRESGLEPSQSFWAAPEMRYPTHFVPSNAESVRAARKEQGLIQGESRITRLLMPRLPAAMVKHFMPGLAFIARKRA